ncbi:hypothetical protein [Paenibacillus sp. MMS20-IR301]|uniref:hypothetical protein n=1 Tax=Paenibacillus sp. MMS20-IR301 TaxID=2895946 RepID=UPI0028EA6402|nr:hypothetical protein [Paenibacillus sp. MMS20-IR301]WNS43544.1 hypothetical protein LOS79_32185 [Paenibacillus sp. MMS20-IR301]
MKISIPHDEAFKKLLETFFKEFIELFFPELDSMLDYTETRFLMQELLVDIVGEEARELDLLLETRYKGMDGYILIHLNRSRIEIPGFMSGCLFTSADYSSATGRSIS